MAQLSQSRLAVRWINEDPYCVPGTSCPRNFALQDTGLDCSHFAEDVGKVAGIQYALAPAVETDLLCGADPGLDLRR